MKMRDLKFHKFSLSSFLEHVKISCFVFFMEKKTKRKEKTTVENKKNQKTDEELMRDLNSKILEEEIDDIMNGNERLVLSSDEDYKEVDGVKMIPFSLEKELGESTIQNGKAGNKDSSEESEGDAQSIDESEDGNATKEQVSESLKSLVDLLGDDETVTDALIKYGKDEEKLIKLTNCATLLLYSGFSSIYTMNKTELIKEIAKNKEDVDQKES